MNHPDPGTAADPATRIAMWSGPRTVSTALMRAWENRPDTVVVDEPLYAFYLDRTGIDHPGRAEVIASQSTDWRVVLARLTSAPPRPNTSSSGSSSRISGVGTPTRTTTPARSRA